MRACAIYVCIIYACYTSVCMWLFLIYYTCVYVCMWTFDPQVCVSIEAQHPGAAATSASAAVS